jgi:1,4-dihydroxy-2-naphthoyl-CoA hydrolase
VIATAITIRPAERDSVVAEPIQQGRTQQLWQVVITRAEDGKAVARGQVRLQNIEASTQP